MSSSTHEPNIIRHRNPLLKSIIRPTYLVEKTQKQNKHNVVAKPNTLGIQTGHVLYRIILFYRKVVSILEMQRVQFFFLLFFLISFVNTISTDTVLWYKKTHRVLEHVFFFVWIFRGEGPLNNELSLFFLYI